MEAKEEILKTRSEYEKEVKERRADLQKQERRLQQKEENLDHKMDAIEKKEEALAAKHAAADKADGRDPDHQAQPDRDAGAHLRLHRRPGQGLPDRPGGVRSDP